MRHFGDCHGGFSDVSVHEQSAFEVQLLEKAKSNTTEKNASYNAK